jgi:hypothetical protein
LFEQFDIEVQKQIHIFFEQASDVLDQARQLLHRRQGPGLDTGGNDQAKPALLTPSARDATLTTLSSGMKRSSSFQRIRWCFLDKKRVVRQSLRCRCIAALEHGPRSGTAASLSGLSRTLQSEI